MVRAIPFQWIWISTLVTGNGKFQGDINMELATILQVDPSMVQIESVQKGSITVTFIVIMVVATVVTSALAGGGLKYAIDRRRRRRNRRPRRRTLRSVSMSVNSVSRTAVDVIPGDTVTVDCDGKQYSAEVLKTFEDKEGEFVVVKYVGDSKPYWLQRKETLSLSSPRLQFIVPSDAEEESVQS